MLEVLERPLFHGCAPVPQLLEHLAPSGMNAIGHLLVERQHPVGEHRDVGGRRRVDAGDLENGEGRAPPGPGLVVGDQLLAHCAGAVGGSDNPIGQRAAADVERLEHVGVGHRANPVPFLRLFPFLLSQLSARADKFTAWPTRSSSMGRVSTTCATSI